MAIKYGIGSTRIRSSDVLGYWTNNMTNISSGDVGGGYEFYGTNTQGGCGNPNGDSGFLILLKNNISWNRITCQFEFNGTASCWTFQGGGTGGGNPGGYFGLEGSNDPVEMNNNPGANLLPYNQSLGDRIFNTVNSFDDSPNFVRKWHACDNDNTNFFHGAFNDSGTKSFWATARRNPAITSEAGIWFGRSCSSVGSFVRVKNIFVWYQGD